MQTLIQRGDFCIPLLSAVVHVYIYIYMYIYIYTHTRMRVLQFFVDVILR